MSLDINKIAQAKITEMEQNGDIKNHIEEKLQKLILDSVTSALNGYDVQKKIKEKIESQISPCLDAMDFTAYNSFICEKVKQITEEYLKEDIANKISNTFEKIFMQKRESIKLSEIFKSYREWLIGDLEEDERYELNNEFYASMEDDKDYWLECSVSKEKPTNSSIYPVNRKDIYTCDFGFRVHKKYNENGVGYIGLVYFEGSSVKDVLKITSYNKFQSLLLNLYYNKTPVILDIEDESNIDTSLGLDI